jgi:hypothetical protein
MFRDLETRQDIAFRKMYSLHTLNNMAVKPGFPKCVKKIGSVKFYDKRAVDRFFDSRVDHRFRENKRAK